MHGDTYTRYNGKSSQTANCLFTVMFIVSVYCSQEHGLCVFICCCVLLNLFIKLIKMGHFFQKSQNIFILKCINEQCQVDLLYDQSNGFDQSGIWNLTKM